MKSLKHSLSILTVLILTTFGKAKSQCTVYSTNGYQVNISVVADSIEVSNGGCSGNWYNYNIHYSYDISFSGSNVPSSLWTLQAYLGCDDGSHYMSLPNSGGTGNLKSGSNVTRYNNDCGSATPITLGCTNMNIEIGGPGIPHQTVSCNVQALPVELISFDAEVINNAQVVLNWQTASELNNDYFTIEKSIDGENFEPVKHISGAGTTNKVQSYTEIDAAPLNDEVYYRLKQTDYDGTFSYSQVVTVVKSAEKEELTVYPNPNEGSAFKVDAGENYGNTQLEITGIDGRTILSLQPESRIVEIDALPRGMYFVRLTNLSKNSSSVVKLTQK